MKILRTFIWRYLAVALLLGASGCRNSSRSDTPSADQGTVPHADHNPRHGGVVLMHGDLHYEVLLDRRGRYQVYFSDALRAPMPATAASKVTITVTRKTGQPETVALTVAEDGESWVGIGRPVEDPETIARIAYEMDGAQYWIDLTFDEKLTTGS